MDDKDKVIDFAAAVQDRMKIEADGDPEWTFTAFDPDVDMNEIEELVGILKGDQCVFLITDFENQRGLKLTPTQAKVLGHQLLKIGTIANLTFEDESGVLEWLLAPEET